MNIGKILISIASTISIVFGVWHFFVPKIWNWYSYIDKTATELILAVRAINVFFSATLVLFGVMNILMVWLEHESKSALLIVIVSSLLLWLIRIIMQIMYPQGAMNPVIQFGMLFVFVLTFILYSIGLFLIIRYFR